MSEDSWRTNDGLFVNYLFFFIHEIGRQFMGKYNEVGDCMIG